MSRKILSRAVLLTAVVTAASGCMSMAPTYERPASPVAATFREAPSTGATGNGDVAALDWQQVFVDDRLRRVIALALDNNRDLRIALLNIEKDRAQYGIQRAALYPTIDASASQTRSRTSAAAVAGTGVSQGVSVGGVNQTASADVGFTSWELDLFGRLRSLKDDALETWLATAETQRSTRLTLVSEVASDWLTVAADQQLLALAKQTLASQSDTLALTKAKHTYGVSSALDVAQVETSVQSARLDVATYTTQLAEARNALELVVGAPVSDALLPQEGTLADAVALAPLPADLDSRVLLQRPDVLSAEHALKAANANIGAARAAFFPTISLTASTGRGSSALSSLFDSGTRTWSFAPSISLPIFDGGALKGDLDVAHVEKNIQVATYEKAIQTAFSEVSDALVDRANLSERLAAQRALVDVSQRSFDLATARHRLGVDSYLDALDSQRSLYSAQQAEISLRLTEATNRVTLYKVLGGGAG